MIDSSSIENLQMLMNSGDGRQAVLDELLDFNDRTQPLIPPNGDRRRNQLSDRFYHQQKTRGVVHSAEGRTIRLFQPLVSKPFHSGKLPEDIIATLDRLPAHAKEPLTTFAEGLACHYNNLFMAIVGNISIVMFHLGPDHPAYGQLRDCEELIHNTALLTRLLVDVFHRPHRRQVTLYPIDLSDREIGKRIFSNGIKKRGPESGSATEIHVQKVLQIIAGNMARRLKRILQFLHHQTGRVFIAKDLQVRCQEHHRQIAIHLKRGITIADALQAYATSAGIDRQPIDLNTVIKEAVAIYQSCFSSLGVTIKDPSTPVRFKGNPQLLRKMLLEILANADDARPQGGEVSITLQRKKTGLNEACCINSVTRMKVQLMVEDNGPGLPDTLGVHAFDPFTKEARGRKRRGLGLASVSGIVKAHRGQIRFFNRQRGGFVMIIELPL